MLWFKHVSLGKQEWANLVVLLDISHMYLSIPFMCMVAILCHPMNISHMYLSIPFMCMVAILCHPMNAHYVTTRSCSHTMLCIHL